MSVSDAQRLKQLLSAPPQHVLLPSEFQSSPCARAQGATRSSRGFRILNAGLTRYRVPRSKDVPNIDTLLVGDPETPSTGAGEPGIVPIAAAIANAVYDRTGQRHRELPIHRYLS
jgi:CO/xanthine dehydrogenase Mo-binding subunit